MTESGTIVTKKTGIVYQIGAFTMMPAKRKKEAMRGIRMEYFSMTTSRTVPASLAGSAPTSMSPTPMPPKI